MAPLLVAFAIVVVGAAFFVSLGIFMARRESHQNKRQ